MAAADDSDVAARNEATGTSVGVAGPSALDGLDQILQLRFFESFQHRLSGRLLLDSLGGRRGLLLLVLVAISGGLPARRGFSLTLAKLPEPFDLGMTPLTKHEHRGARLDGTLNFSPKTWMSLGF